MSEKLKVKSVGNPFEINGLNGSINYMFDIEFEDGKKGKFTTNKKEQNKFIPGQEYIVTEEIKTSSSGKSYIKFDIEKDYNNSNNNFGRNSKPYQSHYDKPDVVESISKTVSHQMAVKLLSKLDIDIQSNLKFKESRKKYATLIYNYFFKDYSKDNTDTINSNCNLKRRSSLDIAIESMDLPFESIHLNSFDNVLNYADEIYKDIV